MLSGLVLSETVVLGDNNRLLPSQYPDYTVWYLKLSEYIIIRGVNNHRSLLITHFFFYTVKNFQSDQRRNILFILVMKKIHGVESLFFFIE